MYQHYFGLREAPFALTPGTAFAFASRAHQEAINTLVVAVQGGEGFVKITGEVGTGKTMLCRRFLDVLQRDNCVAAYLPNPMLNRAAIMVAIARELGLADGAVGDEFELMRWIHAALIEHAAAGRSVVVCVDEAQALSDEALEGLRLLSNLETERRKLLQVVLFGQPELDIKLARHEMRQLQQRMGFEYTLAGLSLRELDRYLAHRLSVAGYAGGELFAPSAVRALHQASRGVPRLVNVLAHKALLCAFGETARVVSAAHIARAVRETSAAAPLSRRFLWFGAVKERMGLGRA